jgi:hypothetical protein
MKPLALWRHEVRRAGLAALLAPPVAGALVLLVAVLGATSGDVSTKDTARTLYGLLEMALPLAAGIGAAGLVGADPSVELQMSVPTAYRTTILRRLVATVGWVSAIAFVTVGAMLATGWWARWPAPHGQLTWIAPTACLAGLGLLLGVLSTSPALATSVVTVVWLFDWAAAGILSQYGWGRWLELFATTHAMPARHWTANRLGLLATGAAMTVGAWLLLRHPDRLLTKETQ